jgi:Protein of unknown function (DUF2786)
MKLEDAIRKVRLLREFSLDRGASEAEAQSATNLAQQLMKRYSIGGEYARAASERPVFHQTNWFGWEQLFDSFGLELRRFGKRGSAIVNKTTILVKADTGEWQAQKASGDGWDVVVKDHGLESLRSYLSKNTPRTYTFFRRG